MAQQQPLSLSTNSKTLQQVKLPPVVPVPHSLRSLVPPPVPKPQDSVTTAINTGSAVLALTLVYSASIGMMRKGIPLDQRKKHLLTRVMSRFSKNEPSYFPISIPSWAVGTLNSICLFTAGILESMRLDKPNIIANAINTVFLIASAHGLYYALRYRTEHSKDKNPPIRFSPTDKGCLTLAALGIGMAFLSIIEQAGLGNFSHAIGIPTERISTIAGITNMVAANIPYWIDYIATTSWSNVRGLRREPPRLPQIFYFAASLTGIIGLPFSTIQAEGMVCWSRVLLSSVMLGTALCTHALYRQRLNSIR